MDAEEEETGDAHQCGVCKQQFTDLESFLKHKSTHVKGSEIQCDFRVKQTVGLFRINDQSVDYLNEAQNSVGSFQQHIEVLFVDSKNFNGDRFCAKDNMNRQVLDDRIAEKPKPFCTVCNKTFKTVQTLRAHQSVHKEDKPFVCQFPMCTYSFRTKGSLVRHERRHTDDRPFECEKCKRKFRESGALTRHRRSQTPCTQKSDVDLPNYGKKQRLPGEIIQETADDPITTDLLTDHQLMLSEDSEHENDNNIGGEMSSDDIILNAEENNIHSSDDVGADLQTTISNLTEEPVSTNVPIKLSICGDGQDGSALVTNTDKQTPETEPPRLAYFKYCLVCKEIFSSLEDLKCHLKNHLTKGTFMCENCSFITDSRRELTAHNTHNHCVPVENSQFIEEQPIHVDLDPKKTPHLVRANPLQTVKDATRAIQQLLIIENTSPDNNSPKLNLKNIRKCPVCEREFKSNSYLKLHMRTHTGERPYKCKHCPKDFPTKDTFKKHLLTHTNERHYKCGECGKLFKRVSHAKEHLKIHTNERPFFCTICQKFFRSSNSFKVHQRTHTDHMPWICKICQKRFREKASLVRHIRTHTGEKPFSCQHCGKSFSEHGTLTRHLHAKIPCTNSLSEARGYTKKINIPVPLNDSEIFTPTVLSEFSSVVTDTQEYITPNSDLEIMPPSSQESEGEHYSVPTGQFIIIEETDSQQE